MEDRSVAQNMTVPMKRLILLLLLGLCILIFVISVSHNQHQQQYYSYSIPNDRKIQINSIKRRRAFLVSSPRTTPSSFTKASPSSLSSNYKSLFDFRGGEVIREDDVDILPPPPPPPPLLSDTDDPFVSEKATKSNKSMIQQPPPPPPPPSATAFANNNSTVISVNDTSRTNILPPPPPPPPPLILESGKVVNKIVDDLNVVSDTKLKDEIIIQEKQEESSDKNDQNNTTTNVSIDTPDESLLIKENSTINESTQVDETILNEKEHIVEDVNVNIQLSESDQSDENEDRKQSDAIVSESETYDENINVALDEEYSKDLIENNSDVTDSHYDIIEEEEEEISSSNNIKEGTNSEVESQPIESILPTNNEEVGESDIAESIVDGDNSSEAKLLSESNDVDKNKDSDEFVIDEKESDSEVDTQPNSNHVVDDGNEGESVNSAPSKPELDSSTMNDGESTTPTEAQEIAQSTELIEEEEEVVEEKNDIQQKTEVLPPLPPPPPPPSTLVSSSDENEDNTVSSDSPPDILSQGADTPVIKEQLNSAIDLPPPPPPPPPPKHSTFCDAKNNDTDEIDQTTTQHTASSENDVSSISGKTHHRKKKIKRQRRKRRRRKVKVKVIHHYPGNKEIETQSEEDDHNTILATKTIFSDFVEEMKDKQLHQKQKQESSDFLSDQEDDGDSEINDTINIDSPEPDAAGTDDVEEYYDSSEQEDEEYKDETMAVYSEDPTDYDSMVENIDDESVDSDYGTSSDSEGYVIERILSDETNTDTENETEIETGSEGEEEEEEEEGSSIEDSELELEFDSDDFEVLLDRIVVDIGNNVEEDQLQKDDISTDDSVEDKIEEFHSYSYYEYSDYDEEDYDYSEDEKLFNLISPAERQQQQNQIEVAHADEIPTTITASSESIPPPPPLPSMVSPDPDSMNMKPIRQESQTQPLPPPPPPPPQAPQVLVSTSNTELSLFETYKEAQQTDGNSSPISTVKETQEEESSTFIASFNDISSLELEPPSPPPPPSLSLNEETLADLPVENKDIRNDITSSSQPLSPPPPPKLESEVSQKDESTPPTNVALDVGISQEQNHVENEINLTNVNYKEEERDEHVSDISNENENIAGALDTVVSEIKEEINEISEDENEDIKFGESEIIDSDSESESESPLEEDELLALENVFLDDEYDDESIIFSSSEDSEIIDSYDVMTENEELILQQANILHQNSQFYDKYDLSEIDEDDLSEFDEDLLTDAYDINAGHSEELFSSFSDEYNLYDENIDANDDKDSEYKISGAIEESSSSEEEEESFFLGDAAVDIEDLPPPPPPPLPQSTTQNNEQDIPPPPPPPHDVDNNNSHIRPTVRIITPQYSPFQQHPSFVATSTTVSRSIKTQEELQQQSNPPQNSFNNNGNYQNATVTELQNSNINENNITVPSQQHQYKQIHIRRTSTVWGNSQYQQTQQHYQYQYPEDQYYEDSRNEQQAQQRSYSYQPPMPPSS